MKTSTVTKLLRPIEAANILGVSLRHLRDLINEGEIIVIRVGDDTRADRIEEAELNRFINRRRTNRNILGEVECPSINVVKSGGLSSKSTAARLDALLGQPAKRKRKNSSVISGHA